ncbi:hypothetical protein INS49_008056 [Diaporthe citri]|uniref:uncharacterized protein n=1 Tax=Diaporthe citri TaxID=83186 RepID=UPI001C7F7213|nr:uncharacterized protein INS49_008056 [Diaporthe citri]KAG6362961.1 hypothetical protein INS49_008056 [Diaporthe citri]
MKVCNLLLGGALAITTNAGVDPPNSNPPIAYFVSYHQPGCLKKDQGAYITLVQTQDSVCYDFSPPAPAIVQSAFVTSIINGCVVYVYNDANCTVNEVTLDLGFENCYDDTTGLGSYKVVCGRRYPIPHTTKTSTSLSASASQK